MTPNERWELLKAELDGREFRSVTATMSAARSTRARHDKRATRQWERQQVQKAVEIGQQTGILPAGIWWLLIKFLIERWIHRYLFAS
jgi:hypothetical protein